VLAPGTSNSKDERMDRPRKTFESDQLDPIYGVREISRGRLKVGSRDLFFFRGNHAQIGKNEYPFTQGLLELPFKRTPNKEVISKSDWQHYKQILNESNVHRLHNRSTRKLRATNTAKWKLISNLLDDFHFNSNEEQSVSEAEDVDMDDSEQDEKDSSDRNITKDVFTPEDDAILEITSPARVDESISHVEVHAHLPFASATFNANDEIRIAVNQQDLCVVPSKSGLHITGQLSKADGTVAQATELVNNAICFLFEELCYELNEVKIDRCRNVGLTSLMKGYASYRPRHKHWLQNAGWSGINDTREQTDENDYFDVYIPLRMLHGFCEDYQKIIVNAQHQLILTRTSTDHNAILRAAPIGGDPPENYRITLSRIAWMLPHVRVSYKHCMAILDCISKDKAVTLAYRSWDLYKYPQLPITPKIIWTVKTASQLEKPRYLIVGFQTDRKNQPALNASHFDHCHLQNVKVYLNSQCYPYGNLNLNFGNAQLALLYEMYAHFQTSYYDKEAGPLLSCAEFRDHSPLIVIDC